MNFLLLYFCFLTLCIIIFGCILNLFENKLPGFVSKLFRYGKFQYKGDTVNGLVSRAIIEVPKNFFRHFYVLGVLSFTTAFYLVTAVYVFKKEPPSWIVDLLNILCGRNRTAYVSATKVYLAIILMTLQVFRRLYDTNFISVFGKNSKINLSHYIVGMLHYPGCMLAILCEAPQFTAIKSDYASSHLNFSQLDYWDIAATITFLWAWYHQYVATKILANLRKNKQGVTVTDDHKLPHGDWFKYLSAPHQSAEILMYTSITIILWYNITWFFVFAWVISNQIETILLTHWWYQDNFEKFPKHRKALIPFIY